MKKISIYCFILISLGFIGCTSKTHEKTIEDFDIREMSLQVDTLYSRMTQAERVAQLYGIRPQDADRCSVCRLWCGRRAFPER